MTASHVSYAYMPHLSFTHRQDHAVILLDGTAATEESNDKDYQANHNQKNSRSIYIWVKEVEIVGELILDIATNSYQCHTEELKYKRYQIKNT